MTPENKTILRVTNHRWEGEPDYRSPRMLRSGDIVWGELTVLREDCCCEVSEDLWYPQFELKNDSGYIFSKNLEPSTSEVGNGIDVYFEKGNFVFKLLGQPWRFCPGCSAPVQTIYKEGTATHRRYGEDESESLGFFKNN